MRDITVEICREEGDMTIAEPQIDTDGGFPVIVRFPVRKMEDNLRALVMDHARKDREEMALRMHCSWSDKPIQVFDEALEVWTWVGRKPVVSFRGYYFDGGNNSLEFASEEPVALSREDTRWLFDTCAGVIRESLGI